VALVAAMTTVLFLGGWHGPWLPGLLWFALKAGAVVMVFVWVRSVLPRFRFDQLMDFGWKVLLPISLLNIVVTGYFALLARP